MAASDPAALVRRHETLKSSRLIHEKVWRDCYDFTYPLRGSGFNGQQITAQEAQSRQANYVVDITAVDSIRILVSAIMGGMTPANSLWFGMHVAGVDDDGVAWLAEASQGLFDNIHGANFDAAGFEANLDGVIAGWFVLYIDEDKDQGGLVFEQWPMAACTVSASKPAGRIDTIFREFNLTTEQAVNTYGLDNLSEAIKKAYIAGQFETRWPFVQAIYPRSMAVVGARLAKNLPFASCHVDLTSKKLVKESGYHEFPCVVPRWLIIPDSVYAVGPVNDALPAIKRLNELARMELAAADLAVAGMWIAEDDGVLNPRTIKVGPRKVIVANSVDSMKELKSGADFNVAWTIQDKLQSQIRKILMADQLQPQDGPAMTATEVHVRVNLIRQLLGPIYARLQSEYLQPMIERCFGLAYRASQLMWANGLAGVFSPPPKSVADREFTIRYVSPLARSQKLEEVSAMDQFETVLMNESESPLGASVLDNYDWDAASRARARYLGVDGKLMRDADAVTNIRTSRAKAQEEAAQQQAMQESMAQAAPKMIERAIA